MADHQLSPAKSILLAVQAVTQVALPTLRTLISTYRKALHNELILRILLTYLPESIESSEYIPFLEDLFAENIEKVSDASIDVAALGELSDEEAKRKVRKLHLLPLIWPNAPADAPDDPVSQFLIHRSLRIDKNTGLISQIPSLLSPFLRFSPDLRTWLISTILPLLRLNYEYYPEEGAAIPISKFETLDDRSGVALLLAQTGKTQPATHNHDVLVGRDLRGLIGPWMYGDTRLKQRKFRESSTFDTPEITLVIPQVNHKYTGWEEVFKWIIGQAQTSWKIAVQAVEQWDGPGDVDLGGFEDGHMWLDEVDQQHLERRYARSVLATAYLIPGNSEDSLNGIQRVLARIISLLDKGPIPTLSAAAALLTPVPDISKSDVLSPKSAPYLRTNFLDEQNPLSAPREEPIKLLHALLISAFICSRAGCSLNIRQAGELVFLQDEREQRGLFVKWMHCIGNGPKQDDKYWIRARNEMLWLRNWGAEELTESPTGENGRGVFGQIPKELMEVDLLKALLLNTRFTLARSIYETSSERPLSPTTLQDTVISAAMNAYDNATNASISRGGVKKCDDILKAFHDTLQDSLSSSEMSYLLKVTDDVGKYRLVLSQGEPFKPVNLRIHGDPISIIGKILNQNDKSYTKIHDFLEMGYDMVRAGLTIRTRDGKTNMSTGGVMNADVEEHRAVAQKRIVGMCIAAALAEDDFETAYSYVITRLKDIAGPSHVRTPDLERKHGGLVALPPPKVIDDWSWRAALEAGKYRRTAQTVKPTHLGNTSGNLDIRHLEQRMDCLSHALRLAPKETLQEILNVYRRCEEELESLVKQETEQEEAWDAQGDDQTTMPGGFTPTPKKHNTTSTYRGAEEAPISLFDLSRSSIARAQYGIAALASIRGNTAAQQKRQKHLGAPLEELSRVSTPDSSSSKAPMRKRDQLKNAAVGGLASGVGWMLGVQAPPRRSSDEDSEPLTIKTSHD